MSDPAQSEQAKRIPLLVLLVIEASVAVGMWFAAPVIVRHTVVPWMLGNGPHVQLPQDTQPIELYATSLDAPLLETLLRGEDSIWLGPQGQFGSMSKTELTGLRVDVSLSGDTIMWRDPEGRFTLSLSPDDYGWSAANRRVRHSFEPEARRIRLWSAHTPEARHIRLYYSPEGSWDAPFIPLSLSDDFIIIIEDDQVVKHGRTFGTLLALLLWTALNLLLIDIRWWRRKQLVTLIGAVVSVGVLVASMAILVKV